MNPLMKLIPKIHTALYRATGGAIGGKMGPFPVVLLTTTGAKTGKERTTPVAYFERDGGYVVVASNGGQRKHPAWYVNQKKTGSMRIQILDKTMDVTARELEGDAYAATWDAVVAVAPQFAEYKTKTTRHIPILLLTPR